MDLSNAFLKAQEAWAKDHPTWPQVYSFCTYRSNAYQNYLYAQGRTRKGVIVTNARGNSSSPHTIYPSLAIDVVFRKNGKEIWNDKYYLLFIPYMTRQGYVSGAFFKKIYDFPHFEVKNWKTVKVNKAVVKKPF